MAALCTWCGLRLSAHPPPRLTPVLPPPPPSAPQATERFVLPSGRELEAEASAPLDLAVVKQRVAQVVRVLANLQQLRQAGVARGDYVARLKADLATYYGYNEWYLAMVRGAMQPRPLAPSIPSPWCGKRCSLLPLAPSIPSPPQPFASSP